MNKLYSISKKLTKNFSMGRFERAVCWPKPDYGPAEIQSSELLNGIRVAAARPAGSPVAACTIMYQAGSRFEVDDQIGASHFLRAGSSCSGCGYSSFAKMRYLQQAGASITCTTDRQTVAFTLRCPVPLFGDLKYYLLDVAARCCYHHWELEDRKPLIRDDLVRISPEQRVLDLVQHASWTGPLSNSIYCEEARIDSMNAESIRRYTKDHFRTDGCTVASVGVPFEETIKLADSIGSSRERPVPRRVARSCARGGFQVYDLGRCSDTWVAVALPGAGTCDIMNLLKHAIIAAACGTHHISRGQHSMDSTPQPPLGLVAGQDPLTQYTAFNISYFETGLLGILARTRAATAHGVAMAAAEFLAHVGDLQSDQIAVGKKRLKMSVALNMENCAHYTEGLALQLANNLQFDSSESMLTLIESISAEEISCTARGLSKLSPCMSVAVVGDVRAVPHDRELVCGL